MHTTVPLSLIWQYLTHNLVARASRRMTISSSSARSVNKQHWSFKMSLETRLWLNAKFVENILKKSESDETIVVKNVTTKRATENGDNYMSDMIRVYVEYSRNKSGCAIEEKTSLLFKIAPNIQGINCELIAEFGVFQTEIQMMKNTLVKMSEALNEKDYRLSARLLHTETTDQTFLVIEDLAPLGYRMADRQAGLDLQHSLLAMRGLAKFHASSVAVCEKEPEQKLLYPRGIYHKDSPEEAQKFFAGGLRIISEEIATWSELGSRAKEYSEKLLKISKVCFQKGIECTLAKDDEFNVINHGDFWVNNMLFRYNEEGNVTDHIFVDFQVTVWSSPATDIIYFLNTSTSYDVYIHHREALIEEYHNVLTNTMLRLGCKTKPPTMAGLQKILKDKQFLELLASFVILPFALVNKEETIKFEQIISGNGYNNPAYKGQVYRKIILSRLDRWNAAGLLDV